MLKMLTPFQSKAMVLGEQSPNAVGPNSGVIPTSSGITMEHARRGDNSRPGTGWAGRLDTSKCLFCTHLKTQRRPLGFNRARRKQSSYRAFLESGYPGVELAEFRKDRQRDVIREPNKTCDSFRGGWIVHELQSARNPRATRTGKNRMWPPTGGRWISASRRNCRSLTLASVGRYLARDTGLSFLTLKRRSTQSKH